MARLHRLLAPFSLSLLLGASFSCDDKSNGGGDDSAGESGNGKGGVKPGNSGKKPGNEKTPGPGPGDEVLPSEQPGESGGGGAGGSDDCDDPDSDCFAIDVLFVIDNSGTMAEEQKNLAANFSRLVDKLKNLKNSDGRKVNASVHMMVTTSDVGHPECTPFQPKDYVPAEGRPTNTTCLERINDFKSLVGKDQTPKKYDDACKDFCEDEKYKPKGSFISFGTGATGSNVPENEIAKALSCIGPQGVNGCGYEAPLEAMMQALNPGADWNKGENPFLRENSLVAIVLVTDEADCSVRHSEKAKESGFVWFTDPKKNEFCEEKPGGGGKKASSAVCWNAGVKCSGLKGDVYEKCVAANLPSKDAPVLSPITRYSEGLFNLLRSTRNSEIVMLGILGVPEVTKHNDKAPFEPIEGGVKALKYRKWRASDIEGEDAEAAVKEKQFEFGIGPGCTGKGTGQGIPPVRIKEVCESLNQKDKKGKIEKVRCCIESICDDDFSAAINCLSGMIESTDPPG